jgi:hypothetical protein
MFSFNI